MRINPKQIDAVMALPGPKRYDHFIKVAADRRFVWGLYNNGWALAGDSEEKQLFPLWPAKEYADLCAKDNWSGYVPKQIDLDDLMEALIPRLRKEGAGLAVFYTPNRQGVVPELDQFIADLRAELGKIE